MTGMFDCALFVIVCNEINYKRECIHMVHGCNLVSTGTYLR